MGALLEAPVALIDRQVELRFHAEDLSSVEIFFQGKSYGTASVVNPHVNSQIGRNWDPHPASLKPTPEIIKIDTPHPTGQLFPNKIEGDL